MPGVGPACGGGLAADRVRRTGLVAIGAAIGRCRKGSTPQAGTGAFGGLRSAVSVPCGRLTQVSYAGDITPEESWKLLSNNPDAVLVDCRTDAEWRWVGVPDLTSLGRNVVFVEWNRSNGQHNDDFVDELIAAGVTPGERPVVFLCRSGNRSIPAAETATAAGIAPSYNMLDGFEGQLDANGHRGSGGWRALGLPWRQS